MNFFWGYVSTPTIQVLQLSSDYSIGILWICALLISVLAPISHKDNLHPQIINFCNCVKCGKPLELQTLAKHYITIILYGKLQKIYSAPSGIFQSKHQAKQDRTNYPAKRQIILQITLLLKTNDKSLWYLDFHHMWYIGCFKRLKPPNLSDKNLFLIHF